MYRIEKRYKQFIRGYEERVWSQWFGMIDENTYADTEEALKSRLKELKHDKESVNRKMKIAEEYRIAEYVPRVPKAKPKRGRKKKTDAKE